jgi:hypothetical protein
MTLAQDSGIMDFDAYLQASAEILRPPFKSTFGALRFKDIQKNPPKYEWLIKGLIAAREVSFLAGPSQSGKSFLAMDLAMSIVRGLPWFGRKTVKGAVVYIAAESAQGVQALRLPAYVQHHGISYDADIPFLLLTRSPNFFRDADGVKRLIKEIKDWASEDNVSISLVVIDTFNAATRGMDEIKGIDASKVREQIQTIVDQISTSVMVVHHMNASGERMRGHSSTFGDANDVLLCRVMEDRKDANGRQIRLMSNDKAKEGLNRQHFEFVLKGVEIGIDEDGDKITSCVVLPPEKREYEKDEATRGAFEFKNENARLLFDCLCDAIMEYGKSAPDEVKGVPLDHKTIDVASWRKIFAKRAPVDALPESATPEEMKAAHEARTERIRKAIYRAIEKFQNLRLIGHDNGLVWLTGRAVRHRALPVPKNGRLDKQADVSGQDGNHSGTEPTSDVTQAPEFPDNAPPVGGSDDIQF